MGRLDKALATAKAAEEEKVEAEVTELFTKPDDIPSDVWNLIQENGRLATERLNSLLSSPRFARYKVADQAKLIAMAQDRAYGKARTNSAAVEAKRRGGMFDATAEAMSELSRRAQLPEYSRSKKDEVEDAVVLDEHPSIIN